MKVDHYGSRLLKNTQNEKNVLNFLNYLFIYLYTKDLDNNFLGFKREQPLVFGNDVHWELEDFDFCSTSLFPNVTNYCVIYINFALRNGFIIFLQFVFFV